MVSGIDSFAYYYLYKWLLTSGEYEWSWQNRKFYPAASAPEEVYLHNKAAYIAPENRELGLTPSSWGLSMDSLESIFTATGIQSKLAYSPDHAELTLENAVSGEDADFLYLSFDNSNGTYDNILIDHIFDAVQEDPSAFAAALMKKDHNPGMTVMLSWIDDDSTLHDMNCSFGQGKLLIPLGSGSGWLLNSHDALNITAQYYGEAAELPAVADYRLLKLREVE